MQNRANSFSITLPASSSITQTALDLFAPDSFRWKSNVTFNLGLRYALHLTPKEQDNRFIVFDSERVALVQCKNVLTSQETGKDELVPTDRNTPDRERVKYTVPPLAELLKQFPEQSPKKTPKD